MRVDFGADNNDNNDNNDDYYYEEDTVIFKDGNNFSTSTRRLPLLVFWLFMGICVLIAACLAHSRSTWQAFWNQEAVLDRAHFLAHFPLQSGLILDTLVTRANELLITGGWIVGAGVILAVQAFYILLVHLRRPESIEALKSLRQIRIQKLIAIEALVLLLGTVFFLIGTRIFSYISEHIGSCSYKSAGAGAADVNVFTFPINKSDCLASSEKATFRGFDISGHCFLILHSCLMALEYSAKAVYLWNCDGGRGHKSNTLAEKDSDLESLPESSANLPVIINSEFNRLKRPLFWIFCSILAAVALLCFTEFLIFLQTILFYHTVLEKILGTIFGALYWIGLFILSQKYPHLF